MYTPFFIQTFIPLAYVYTPELFYSLSFQIGVSSLPYGWSTTTNVLQYMHMRWEARGFELKPFQTLYAASRMFIRMRARISIRLLLFLSLYIFFFSVYLHYYTRKLISKTRDISSLPIRGMYINTLVSIHDIPSILIIAT